jgi:hypothetical protein
MKKQILSEEFKRMQKLAGIITESQLNEENKVINPDDLSELEVYEDLDEAGKKLKELENSSENSKDPEEIKRIANLVYNTAAHEVHKLREKYKTNSPVSDFAKKSLNRQFEWDDKKVHMDPINKKAQDYMQRAEKFIRIDDESEIEDY